MINCGESHTRKAKVASIILHSYRCALLLAFFFGLPWTIDFFEIPVTNRGAAPTFGELLVQILGFLVVGALGLMALGFDELCLRGKFRLGWTAYAYSLAEIAKSGNAEAQYSLGMCFLKESIGIERNETSAMEWLDQSAMQGHPEAQYHLAENLSRCHWFRFSYGVRKGFLPKKVSPNQVIVSGLPSGDLTYRDACKFWAEDEALDLYKKAADQGHVAAIIRLGEKFSKCAVDEEFDEEVLEYLYFGLAVKIWSSGHGRTDHGLDDLINSPIGSLTLGFGWELHNWQDVKEWKQRLVWLEEAMSSSDLRIAKQLLKRRASEVLERLAQRDDHQV